MRVCLVALVLSASHTIAFGESLDPEPPKTTFDRFLPLAQSNDPEMQYALAFMYFYGEGIERSYDRAHYWFHRAAEQGDPRSQLNLGVFHAGLLPQIPERYRAPHEANLWFSLAAATIEDTHTTDAASRSYERFLAGDLEEVLRATEPHLHGRAIYRTLCAGCHGFEGLAPHASIPSFAKGDGLAAPNHALIESVLRGNRAMPGWEASLSEPQVRSVVSYLRHAFANPGRVPSSTSPDTSRPRGDAPTSREGSAIYLQFCGGCHGFNGISTYVNSPSFALRERMEKSDRELAASIRSGVGVMPSWENMLADVQIDALIAHIRTLGDEYERGISAELRSAPSMFFRFRPRGERSKDWIDADPAGG